MWLAERAEYSSVALRYLEQILRAEPRRVYVLFLFLTERSFQQQIRHPQDAAERRSDFVVETREKLSLQLAKLVVFLHDALIPTIGTWSYSFRVLALF